MNQLVFVGIDIGDHAQRLHSRRAQVLRLVNDEHHTAALAVLADQKALEGIVAGNGRESVVGLSKSQHDPFCQVGQIGVGVGDKAHRNLFTQLSEQAVDQRCLPATDVAADHCEAGAVEDGVLQHGVGE